MEILNIGLDISTSNIGICLFKNKSFYKMLYVDMTKEKDLFLKTELFKKEIDKLDEERFDKINIYIEDILMSFSKGFSSSNIITKLAKFNGIISYIVYDKFNVKPNYINVNSARKQLDIKIDKKLNIDKKEQVLLWVDKDLNGNFLWPMKKINRGKNKGIVKYENFCYDMADAYVICKSGILTNEGNS